MLKSFKVTTREMSSQTSLQGTFLPTPNTQHPTSTWTTSFSHLEKYILRNAR